MIDELLGIQYNIEKAKVDGKVQNICAYINEKTLMARHLEMDGNKAKGSKLGRDTPYRVKTPGGCKEIVTISFAIHLESIKPYGMNYSRPKKEPLFERVSLI